MSPSLRGGGGGLTDHSLWLTVFVVLFGFGAACCLWRWWAFGIGALFVGVIAWLSLAASFPLKCRVCGCSAAYEYKGEPFCEEHHNAVRTG